MKKNRKPTKLVAQNFKQAARFAGLKCAQVASQMLSWPSALPHHHSRLRQCYYLRCEDGKKQGRECKYLFPSHTAQHASNGAKVTGPETQPLAVAPCTGL